MRKQVLVVAVLLSLSLLLWYGTGSRKVSLETETRAPVTALPEEVDSQAPDAASAAITETGNSFPVVKGWPLEEERVFGEAEQRQILGRAQELLAAGAITEEEFDETVLQERQHRIDMIDEYNDGPAEREALSHNDGEGL